MYNIKFKDYGFDDIQVNFYSYFVRTGSFVPDYEFSELEFGDFVNDIPFNHKFRLSSGRYFFKFYNSDLKLLKNIFDYDPQVFFQDSTCFIARVPYNFDFNNVDWVPDNRSKDDYFLNNLRVTKNKVYDYSRANRWDYFCTFTFNQEVIDRYDLNLCLKTFRKWLNNFKCRFCKDLRYICVSELCEDGAAHVHGLFSGFPEDLSTDGGILINNKIDGPLGPDQEQKQSMFFNWFDKSDQKWRVGLRNYKLGISDIERIRKPDRICSYLTKYITKELFQIEDFYRNRYFHSKGLKLPEEKTELVLAEREHYFDREQPIDFVSFCRDRLPDREIVHIGYGSFYDRPVAYLQTRKKEAAE